MLHHLIESFIFSFNSSSSSLHSVTSVNSLGSSKLYDGATSVLASIFSMIACSLLNISWCVIAGVFKDTQNFPVLLCIIALMH